MHPTEKEKDVPLATPWLLAALVCILALFAVDAQAAGRNAATIEGSWRVARGVPGPWVSAGRTADARAWLGQTVQFEAGRVRGPGVLACGHARYEATRMPPDGLFQGVLPAPTQAAARALGLKAGVVDGVRLSCDTGVFELHRADADTLLVAVDNVVWTLVRNAGGLAAAPSPESTVQTLLEQHFAGDMGFDATTLTPKQRYLSSRLQRLTRSYLARPQPADEVPSINGDPFTDSQDYPTRFAVGRAQSDGQHALVPVRLADGYSQRTLTYALVREGGAWRVDDVRYGHGPALSTLLR